MNYISSLIYPSSLPKHTTAIQALHSFDIEEYEENLLLHIPLEIMEDPYLTNLYIREEINYKIQELVKAALLENKPRTP